MKRILAALFTFSIGVGATYLLTFASAMPADEVPAVRHDFPANLAVIEGSEPKFVPFFDSLGNENYFFGWFIADEFTGMDEVWTILLNREMNDNGKLEFYTMVLTTNPDGSSNDTDSFLDAAPTADADRLAFTTSESRGIRYSFDGRFKFGGSAFAQNEKVLRGTLKKLKKGKVVATFTSDFKYAEPHCFH